MTYLAKQTNVISPHTTWSVYGRLTNIVLDKCVISAGLKCT